MQIVNVKSIANHDRKKYLDIAKAIALLLVISGHIGMGKLLNIWSYSFHLPVFFIVSGYLYEAEPDFNKYLNKKIFGYIVPYISFSIVIVVFDFFFYGVINGSFLHTFKMILGLIVQRRCTTLWFLASLFIGIIIFSFVVKICKSDFKIITFSLGLSMMFVLYDMAIKKPLPWNIDTAFIAQLYFAIGYIAKRRTFFEEIFSYKKSIQLIIVAMFGIIGTSLTYINYITCGKYFEMFEGEYGVFPITIIASVLLSFSLIILSNFLTKIKLLLYLGENSMVYFAVHLNIVIPLVSLIMREQESFLNNRIMIFGIKLIMTLLICYVIDNLISYTNVYWLFGKKEKKNRTALCRPARSDTPK